jgi:hypothetical protein
MANATYPNMGDRPVPGAGGSYAGEQPAGDAAGIVKEQAGIAKERAAAMLDDAKQTARSKIHEGKSAAADGVGEFAGALREAARSRRHGDDDPVMRLTESAADGLERLSGMLRSKDVGSMLSDVNRFARQQPVVFFGLALAAGFVAVRLFKDAAPAVRAEMHRDDDLDYSEPMGDPYRDEGEQAYGSAGLDTGLDTGVNTRVDTHS